MKSVEKVLSSLIKSARELGLNNEDIENANEFLQNYEYELCFDTIVTQLYECKIKININFFNLSIDVIKRIGLSRAEYDYLNELL